MTVPMMLRELIEVLSVACRVTHNVLKNPTKAGVTNSHQIESGASGRQAPRKKVAVPKASCNGISI